MKPLKSMSGDTVNMLLSTYIFPSLSLLSQIYFHEKIFAYLNATILKVDQSIICLLVRVKENVPAEYRIESLLLYFYRDRKRKLEYYAEKLSGKRNSYIKLSDAELSCL